VARVVKQGGAADKAGDGEGFGMSGCTSGVATHELGMMRHSTAMSPWRRCVGVKRGDWRKLRRVRPRGGLGHVRITQHRCVLATWCRVPALRSAMNGNDFKFLNLKLKC
jgi:hypothetical protein